MENAETTSSETCGSCESYRYYKKAQQALKVKGIQARLPYMVDFY